MSLKKICILDYGSGNSMSVYNAIKFLNYKVTLSSKINDIKTSSHLILPELIFLKCFKKTTIVRIDQVLNKKLILGILCRQYYTLWRLKNTYLGG